MLVVFRQAGRHTGAAPTNHGLGGWLLIDWLFCDLLLPAAITDCIRDHPVFLVSGMALATGNWVDGG